MIIFFFGKTISDEKNSTKNIWAGKFSLDKFYFKKFYLDKNHIGKFRLS